MKVWFFNNYIFKKTGLLKIVAKYDYIAIFYYMWRSDEQVRNLIICYKLEGIDGKI